MYLLRYPTQVVHILIFFVEGWANPRWKTSFGGLASGRHGTLPTFCGKVWDDGNDLSINRPVQESLSRYFFIEKYLEYLYLYFFLRHHPVIRATRWPTKAPLVGNIRNFQLYLDSRSWTSLSIYLSTLYSVLHPSFSPFCFLGRRVWQGQNESRCQKSERTECRG